MPNQKELKFKAEFRTNEGVVKAEIIIIEGWSLAKFSDPKYAKKLYELERRSGNKNIKYHKESNTIAQEYKNLNIGDISKIIIKELGACRIS